MGFTVTFTSNEVCEDDSSKFYTFTIDAVCSPDGTQKEGDVTYSTCSAYRKDLGKYNCKTFDASSIVKFLDKLSQFTGILLIGFGLVLTFAGAKFLLLVFTILIFIGVTGASFLLVYNLFLDPIKTEQSTFAIVFVVAAILGGVAAYFSKKFAKAWATTLLAVWAGFVGMMLLVKLVGIGNKYAEFFLVLAGAIGAGFLGKKLDKHIKSIGTAFIGSYLLIRGIGSYVGGYPSMAEDGEIQTYNPYVWAYFAAFVAFVIGGSYVQLRILKAEDEDKKDDAFEGEEEAKICGCL